MPWCCARITDFNTVGNQVKQKNKKIKNKKKHGVLLFIFSLPVSVGTIKRKIIHMIKCQCNIKSPVYIKQNI